MMTGYALDEGRLRPLTAEEDPGQALWLDLAAPSAGEIARAAAIAGVALPDRPEMEEIELSSRLYQDAGAAYLTVVLPDMTETGAARIGPATFVLAPKRLVTLRYHAPRPFETYPGRADKTAYGCATAEAVLLGLIEEIVDRLADILERAGREMEALSHQVFRRGGGRRDLQGVLEAIGRKGDLVGDIGVSLLSVERALGFLDQILDRRKDGGDLGRVVATQLSDLRSIAEHSGFLSQKVGLMLDATLGMISIEQNAAIRIFSVLAVLFLPPTLIASVYGMNFAHMPELAWPWGYPLALALMVGSALGTWLVFRWRGWM